MEVQYMVNSSWILLIADETRRTIALHLGAWEARVLQEHEKYGHLGMDTRAPKLDIPDELFFGVYCGIKVYHGEGMSKPALGGYDQPHTQKLRGHLEKQTRRLMDFLIENGQENERLREFRSQRLRT